MTAKQANTVALIFVAEVLFLITLSFLPPLHKLYAIAGVMGLCATFAPEPFARKCFWVFGGLCTATSVLGFIYGAAPLFGSLPNQYGDRWFYLCIASTAVYLAIARDSGQGEEER
jgi:hypothetical protein